MSISIEALSEAIRIKEEISRLEVRLERLLGAGGESKSAANPAPAKKGRRKMSAAARAKIAAAQRARWAKAKAK